MNEFGAMTVRELIIALTEVEQEIRQLQLPPPLNAEAAGRSQDEDGSQVGTRLVELGVREQRIVDELRSRRGQDRPHSPLGVGRRM